MFEYELSYSKSHRATQVVRADNQHMQNTITSLQSENAALRAEGGTSQSEPGTTCAGQLEERDSDILEAMTSYHSAIAQLQAAEDTLDLKQIKGTNPHTQSLAQENSRLLHFNSLSQKGGVHSKSSC